MTVTTTTHEELEARARNAFRRARDVFAAVDPALPVGPEPDAWTCHEVAAHVLTVLYRYTRWDFTQPEGMVADATDLNDLNDDEMAAVVELDHAELIRQLEHEFEVYITNPPLPLDLGVPFHGMVTVNGAAAAGNMIGELLIHARDVAVAADRRWPLDSRDMVLVCNALLQIAPAWVDKEGARGKHLSLAVHINGGTPQVLEFEDAVLTVRDRRPGDRLDATVRGPAPAFGLLFYSRISLPGAIRRGVIATGGRRPWRAFAFPDLILNA